MEVVVTAEAELDLMDIGENIGLDSPGSATRFVHAWFRGMNGMGFVVAYTATT